MVKLPKEDTEKKLCLLAQNEHKVAAASMISLIINATAP